jgi:hypothetical protein
MRREREREDARNCCFFSISGGRSGGGSVDCGRGVEEEVGTEVEDEEVVQNEASISREILLDTSLFVFFSGNTPQLMG